MFVFIKIMMTESHPCSTNFLNTQTFLQIMTWKILSDTPDLKLLEKKKGDLNIRIEARLTREKKWDIYKIYVGKSMPNLVEEYHAQTGSEAEQLISSLKKKELTLEQIREMQKTQIVLRREFNEVNVEKWVVSVSRLPAGAVFVRYYDPITVDIILDERYASIESSILREAYTTLGIEDEGKDQTIYYYTRKSRAEKKPTIVGKIEFGIAR